ncbi:hypothetical protein [Marinisporobacter balticus]|uniref:Uncharacterized protein n=1 Tax=Marinisporobacter balticus TaxID=2018667 RepID=A0A4R2L1D1_9FIRM|nr:hypothetical protein [Marinisporobacter balticus]TCO80073.1 hypothetical protein EV214_101311 [Marinisporobacter balticus]
MNLQNLEMKIEENVLNFLVKGKFNEDIEDAKEYFNRNFGEVMVNDKWIIDFNSWLIYDYKMKKGKTIIEKYHEFMEDQLSDEENEWIEKRIQSYLSLYELKRIEENEGLLQDIFTKKEYWINLDQIQEMKSRDLILARRIKIAKQYKLIGNTIYVPEIFRNDIEKNILIQYEEYKYKSKYGSVEEFLKSNRLLLEKYIEIIIDVTQETEDEESYNVWQSIYIIHDIKEVKQKLLNHEAVQLDYEENVNCYFRLVSDNRLLAEIVLGNNRIELECTSESDRINTKKMIQSILGDLVKHYKDEVIGIESII